MLTTAELVAMRQTSASALPDTIEITRPSTSTTFDPDTFTETPDPPTVIYSGAGRVRTPQATEMERLFGDTEVTVQRYAAKVPHDATGITRNDRVAVTDGTDPDIVGRSFRVVSVISGSNWIDRTLGLEEVVG